MHVLLVRVLAHRASRCPRVMMVFVTVALRGIVTLLQGHGRKAGHRHRDGEQYQQNVRAQSHR